MQSRLLAFLLLAAWAVPVCLAAETNAPLSEIDKLKEVALAGNVTAMSALASFYQAGAGVERDMKQAIEWLKKAAGAGHAESMRRLAGIYLGGDGVEKD